MAIGTIYKCDKVVLPSSVEFSQVRSSRWMGNVQSISERPAGHPHPMFQGVQSIKPAFEFTTPELDVLLAAIGVGGASVGSSTTYFKAGAATGSVARATTSHKKVVITSSVGYWTQIRLPHNGIGEATVMLQAIYDGSNDPFITTSSVALSGNLGVGTYFGAGPVSMNGTALTGVQEISIDSGVRLIQAGDASEEFDTFVGVEMTEPVVTIKFMNVINWDTVGIRGVALNGSTGLVFYARKYKASAAGSFSAGTRVANATAEHIKFIGLNGVAVPVDTNGQQSSPTTDTIQFRLSSASDSVVPLTGTVSSAIT